MQLSKLIEILRQCGVDGRTLLHFKQFMDAYIEFNLQIPKFVYYFASHKELVLCIKSPELGNHTYSFDALNRIATDVSNRTGWDKYDWSFCPNNTRDIIILDGSIL